MHSRVRKVSLCGYLVKTLFCIVPCDPQAVDHHDKRSQLQQEVSCSSGGGGIQEHTTAFHYATLEGPQNLVKLLVSR